VADEHHLAQVQMTGHGGNVCSEGVQVIATTGHVRPAMAAAGRFDAVGSYLVLNDVANYCGFAATLAASLKPGGRLVLALNNP
jgi:hypothetical protein